MKDYGSNSGLIIEGLPEKYFDSPTEAWMTHGDVYGPAGKQPTGKYPIKELLKDILDEVKEGWKAMKAECKEEWNRRKGESEDTLLKLVEIDPRIFDQSYRLSPWMTHGEKQDMTQEQKEKVLAYMSKVIESLKCGKDIPNE
jgi:hypothetical protein